MDNLLRVLDRRTSTFESMAVTQITEAEERRAFALLIAACHSGDTFAAGRDCSAFREVL